MNNWFKNYIIKQSTFVANFQVPYLYFNNLCTFNDIIAFKRDMKFSVNSVIVVVNSTFLDMALANR